MVDNPLGWRRLLNPFCELLFLAGIALAWMCIFWAGGLFKPPPFVGLTQPLSNDTVPQLAIVAAAMVFAYIGSFTQAAKLVKDQPGTDESRRMRAIMARFFMAFVML